MIELPSKIRRMVEARVLDKQLRDQVLMGYSQSAQTFWLATVDGHGAIDQEFAQPMPNHSYALLMQLVRSLVAQRGGHISAELVMASLNSSRTLQ